jgi:hypothetical protein
VFDGDASLGLLGMGTRDGIAGNRGGNVRVRNLRRGSRGARCALSTPCSPTLDVEGGGHVDGDVGRNDLAIDLNEWTG